MATALSDFVNKKENAAISDTVHDIVEAWQEKMKKSLDDVRLIIILIILILMLTTRMVSSILRKKLRRSS